MIPPSKRFESVLHCARTLQNNLEKLQFLAVSDLGKNYAPIPDKVSRFVVKGSGGRGDDLRIETAGRPRTRQHVRHWRGGALAQPRSMPVAPAISTAKRQRQVVSSTRRFCCFTSDSFKCDCEIFPKEHILLHGTVTQVFGSKFNGIQVFSTFKSGRETGEKCR
ncbi:hypothetical protein V3C99_016611 [Haemonchus contortus]